MTGRDDEECCCLAFNTPNNRIDDDNMTIVKIIKVKKGTVQCNSIQFF